VVYAQVKGTLSSQMAITTVRLVAGAYAAATRNSARRAHPAVRRAARRAAPG
jgi:hypothetical protein